MCLCETCNCKLEFKLVIHDEEDNKTKKLYLCSKCEKYYFINEES